MMSPATAMLRPRASAKIPAAVAILSLRFMSLLRGEVGSNRTHLRDHARSRAMSLSKKRGGVTANRADLRRERGYDGGNVPRRGCPMPLARSITALAFVLLSTHASRCEE